MTAHEDKAGRTTASDGWVLNPFAPPDVPDARLNLLLWNDHWLGNDLGEPISVTTPAGARIELRFTRDREHQSVADAVILHGPTIRDLPVRRAGQPWVMVSMESYANYPLLAGAEKWGAFDLTMTHRLDSDVPIPYATRKALDGASMLERPQQQGSAVACFIASNPVPARDAYVRELMEYVPIDCFGACLNNRGFGDVAPTGLSRSAEAVHAIASYPFYLAFENSIEQDYVTEKLYRPLSVGTVPVYQGAPNVAAFLPSPDAAIVIDAIAPRELATLLLREAADPALLDRRHAWRASPAPAFERLLELSSIDGRARLATKLAHGCGRECVCGGRQR